MTKTQKDMKQLFQTVVFYYDNKKTIYIYL